MVELLYVEGFFDVLDDFHNLVQDVMIGKVKIQLKQIIIFPEKIKEFTKNVM